MVKYLMAAVVALAVLGLAADGYAAKAPKAGKGAKAGKGGAAVAPPAIPTEVTATISKVENNEVTVTLKLPTDFGTRVLIGGESKGLGDLKAGQSVKVQFSGSSVSKIEVTQ